MHGTGVNMPGLGETIPGTDSDGNLINTQLLGVIKRFENANQGASSSIDDKKSNGPVWAILLRNSSSGILLPKRLAKCKQTAGYNLIEAASGYTAALYDHPCVAIDPWLHATNGVADKYLFWGIISGPTILKLPSSGSDILETATVGCQLIASADANGRPTAIDTSPDDATAALKSAQATFGTALGIFSNADTDDEVSVLMHCPWFPIG